MYDKPWIQGPRSRVSPDTEVHNIMKTNGARPKTPLKGSQFTRPYAYSPGESLKLLKILTVQSILIFVIQ